MRRLCVAAAALAAALAVVAAADTRVADVVYLNGRILTVSEAQPAAEALAIRGNTFLAVGSNRHVLKHAGPGTSRIDLKGRTVVPGLIDSHTHPSDAGLSERDGPLPPFPSVAAIQDYIRRRVAATPGGAPIVVPKIFATRLAERRYPERRELDAAAADRPVLVDNGYASVANTALLRQLGIDRRTPDPPNGKIVRGAGGEPTGLILGGGQLVAGVRDRDASPDEVEAAIARTFDSYLRVGITSTTDRAQRAGGFRAYQRLKASGRLRVRTSVTFSLAPAASPGELSERIRAIPFTTGWGDEWLRVGPLKMVADGGILTGTALLRQPYGSRTAIYGYSDPAFRGVQSVPTDQLIAFARTAHELGWQATAHVTGGGSLDLLLDAYEAAHRDRALLGRRFTATHGNFPDARAIARAAAVGVAFDVQPAWLHLDASVVTRVLGAGRMRDFLPLKSLLKAGLLVAGGSDHMVRLDPRDATNPYHPFFGMWMFITRRTVDGDVINPDERLDRLEALKLWTVNGARLTFEDRLKGSIEPGKLADFVVLSEDYLSCPIDRIQAIEALATIVDGKVVYRDSSMTFE